MIATSNLVSAVLEDRTVIISVQHDDRDVQLSSARRLTAVESGHSQSMFWFRLSVESCWCCQHDTHLFTHARTHTPSKLNSVFHLSGVGKSGWGWSQTFTCVRWQLTLCDFIWQVTLRSSVISFLLRAIHHFYAQSSYCFQRVLAIAIMSVRLSVTRVNQSKAVQARITKSSPSAAWKTLVSGTVKLFHKYDGVTPNENAKWKRGW